MANATTLRPAVPADVVKIRVLLGHLVEEAWENGGTDFPAIDDEVLLPFILEIIRTCWCGIVEHESDGRSYIVGSLALKKTRFFWSHRELLMDSWYFVLPNFRKTRAAVNLMKAAQAWADSQELPMVIGINSGLDLERKEHFYTRMGFDLRGHFFSRGL